MEPRPASVLARYAERILAALDGNPYPMTALYRIASTGDMKLELIRSQTPEEARLEASGWRVCGVYRRGVTLKQLKTDLAECR